MNNDGDEAIVEFPRPERKRVEWRGVRGAPGAPKPLPARNSGNGHLNGAIPIEEHMRQERARRAKVEEASQEKRKSNGHDPNGPITEHLPTQSEARLAEIYAKRHAGRLCYVERRNRWMEWSGHKWCEDDTLRGFDLARDICLEEARRLDNKGRDAIACTSSKTVAAVEKQARAHRRLAARIEDFDGDLSLINTTEGEVICSLPNGPTLK